MKKTSLSATSLLPSLGVSSSWKALRRLMRVLKKATCWNSGSASSNRALRMSCPKLRFKSTLARPKSLAGRDDDEADLLADGAVIPRPIVLDPPDTFWTRLDNCSSTRPVSKRTAVLVGVVAVI